MELLCNGVGEEVVLGGSGLREGLVIEGERVFDRLGEGFFEKRRVGVADRLKQGRRLVF
jgi:hypothetical protein